MANIILKNASGQDVTYNGVEVVRLANSGGGTVDFSQGGGTIVENVVGPPVVITLSRNWTGTTQTVYLTGDEYANADVDALQLGIPATSSSSNANALISAAITMPQARKETITQEGVSTTRITMIFSAVYAPTIDVRISVYGLLGGGDNI